MVREVERLKEKYFITPVALSPDFISPVILNDVKDLNPRLAINKTLFLHNNKTPQLNFP